MAPLAYRDDASLAAIYSETRRAGTGAALRSKIPDRLLLGSFLLLTFLLGCFELANSDIWWQIRTGQLIWERHEIPRTDLFTYTNPESPWIDLHWGFQLLVAGLWSLGGSAALIVGKSLLGTGTFALALAAGKNHWPTWQTVALWLMPLLLFAGRYYVRPEMLSVLFLAAFLLVLFRAREHPVLIWSLPVVQLLWVNVQGLFILGPILLACYLVEHRSRHSVWAATGLTVAACFVNPYGIRGATFPLVLLQRIQGDDRPFYRRLSAEFEGLGEFVGRHGLSALGRNLSTLLLVALFLAVMASFLVLLRRRRTSPFRLLAFAAFAFLAWQSSRNSVLFALVAGAVLRWNVGEIVEDREATSRRSAPTARPASAVLILLLVLVLAVPTGLLFALRPAPVPRRFGFGQAERWYAHDAARFLGRPEMPSTVYAFHTGQAAVYMFHNGPERKVFADPRLEVNRRETLERYLRVRQLLPSSSPSRQAAAAELLGRDPEGRLPALLIDRHARDLILALDAQPRWRAVFCGAAAAVFIERDEATRLGLTEIERETLVERLRLHGDGPRNVARLE